MQTIGEDIRLELMWLTWWSRQGSSLVLEVGRLGLHHLELICLSHSPSQELRMH